MTRVLILSKNILADQALQHQIQQLNYETFVSSSIYDAMCCRYPMNELVSAFDIVLFSENLTHQEIDQVLPLLVSLRKKIICRTYEKHPAASSDSVRWIHVSASPIDLKMMIEDLSVSLRENDLFDNKSYKLIDVLKEVTLTPLERKLMQYLVRGKTEVVTKDDIADVLWGQPLTTSKKIQIYNLTGSIKEKLCQAAGSDNTVYLTAQRGHGYFLTDAFFETFYWKDTTLLMEAAK